MLDITYVPMIDYFLIFRYLPYLVETKTHYGQHWRNLVFWNVKCNIILCNVTYMSFVIKVK